MHRVQANPCTTPTSTITKTCRATSSATISLRRKRCRRTAMRSNQPEDRSTTVLLLLFEPHNVLLDSQRFGQPEHADGNRRAADHGEQNENAAAHVLVEHQRTPDDRNNRIEQ